MVSPSNVPKRLSTISPEQLHQCYRRHHTIFSAVSGMLIISFKEFFLLHFTQNGNIFTAIIYTHLLAATLTLPQHDVRMIFMAQEQLPTLR